VMSKNYFLLIICFVLSISLCYTQSWKNYPYSPSGSLISFPNDEGRHDGEPIEWWYTSGHLSGTNTGNHYSYMLSFFYYPAYGYDGFRIFNLSNDDSGQFFSDVKPLNYIDLALDSLNIQAYISPEITDRWANKTDVNGKMIPFEYSLSAISDDGTINLEYDALKPPLILGDNGFFNQGATSYTYYYSQTKNSVSGTINFNGITEDVIGTSWIDRQYGTFNPLTEEDYEWFCIQLSNDMDINLWNLFTKDRHLPDTSTYRYMSVYVDDNTQYTTDNFEIERLSFHFMPDSGRCYSQKWRLTSSVNNMDLIITTFQNNSEVQLPFRFFEGSTTITGTVNGIPVNGIGFAELLHSYEKPDITISNPTGGSWNSFVPIRWYLRNADDGRPLKYDLEYSIDNKQSFFPIVQALTDTLYYWESPSLASGDSCWFKVTAYSIDSTLQNAFFSSNPAIFNPDLTSVYLSENKMNDNRIIHLYPNPTKDMLMIDLNNRHPFLQYQIVNVFGQIFFQESINNSNKLEIDLLGLASGVYFIGLISEDRTVVSKFIVR